jgi:hypothetical protein
MGRPVVRLPRQVGTGFHCSGRYLATCRAGRATRRCRASKSLNQRYLSEPAVGGLAAKTVSTHYNSLGLPTTVSDNNPATSSDPTGMRLANCAGGWNECGPGAKSQSGAYTENVDGSASDSGTASAPSTGNNDSGTNQVQKKNGCGSWGFLSSICSAAGESFYGSLSIAPRTLEQLNVFDSCFWTSGGCDYGAQYDNYMAEQGYDINSDYCRVPGALAAIFGMREDGGLESDGPGSSLAKGLSEDAAAGAKRMCSFAPTTPVLMAGGKTKQIGKIKVGDHVEAADPDTGKHKGSRTVLATIVNHDNDLVDLTIETAPGHTEVIHTTSRHPFWDDTLHSWTPAGNLKTGHLLETATNSHVRITTVDALKGAADMYNLTVEQLHTYYVLAGETPVLVHNAGGDRFIYLDRPGYSNYMLVDRGGNVYYSGMFGPGETPAGVQYRHANNNNRFNPANGDTMRVVPGTRTYGESRLMEQRFSEQYGTYIGRDGSNYRGNRQNPLAGSKRAEYEGYEATKLGGCP